MALIKCPECGREVSDKADKCIHCGYPLKVKSIINNQEYDLSYELELVLDGKNIEAIKSVREKIGLGLADGKSIIDYMSQHNKCPIVMNFNKQQENNLPKCPTCGSTDIEKISLTKKAFGGAMFGIFSSDIRNSMHCRNCGAKW
ncbi:zinc-ribbon domain-containing protein [Lachnospiraceae bacterium 62-35]